MKMGVCGQEQGTPVPVQWYSTIITRLGGDTRNKVHRCGYPMAQFIGYEAIAYEAGKGAHGTTGSK